MQAERQSEVADKVGGELKFASILTALKLGHDQLGRHLVTGDVLGRRRRDLLREILGDRLVGRVELDEKERRIAEEITRSEGKPEQAVPKIVEGRLGAFFKDIVLTEQASVKDPKQNS